MRTLVDQARQYVNQSSSSSEIVQELDELITKWSNLQKKVETKVAIYTDLNKLYEELRGKIDCIC